MYVLKDRVELGHSKDTGGSIDIEFHFSKMKYAVKQKEVYLKVMDTLDHCLITDSLALANECVRYFLLSKSKGVFKDAVTCLTWALLDRFDDVENTIYALPDLITITLGKETYGSVPNIRSNVLSASTEG